MSWLYEAEKAERVESSPRHLGEIYAFAGISGAGLAVFERLVDADTEMNFTEYDEWPKSKVEAAKSCYDRASKPAVYEHRRSGDPFSHQYMLGPKRGAQLMGSALNAFERLGR